LTVATTTTNDDDNILDQNSSPTVSQSPRKMMSSSSATPSSTKRSNILSPSIGIDTVGGRPTSSQTSSGIPFPNGYNNPNPASSMMTMMNNLNTQSTSTASATNTNFTTGAQLLSSSGIDTSSLFHKSQSLDSKQSTKNITNNNMTSTNTATSTTYYNNAPHENYNINISNHNSSNLHSLLESVRNETISKILSQQKMNIRSHIETKIQNRIMEDWNQSKKELMNKFIVLDEHGGLITLGGGGAVVGDGNNGNVDVGRGGSTMIDSNVLSSSLLMSGTNDSAIVNEFHSLASYHYSNIFDNNSYGNDDGLMNMITKISHDLSVSNSFYNPYYNANKLISTLLSSQSSSSRSSGLQGLGMNTNQSKLSTVYDRTTSSLLFLSNQFRDYLITKVKNSSSSSSTTSSNGFIGYITKYVEIEYGHDYFYSGKRDVLFKCIYYSLRCGDVHTALELYNSSRVGGSSDNGNIGVLKVALENLVRSVDSECNRSGISGGGSRGSNKDEKCIGLFHALHTLSSESIKEMKDLYNHVMLNSHGEDGDENEYEIALLGMLSFSDITEGKASRVANATIDDYVFLALWNTLAPGSNLVDGVVSIGERIKSYGSDHFEGGPEGVDPKSCGWAYAMPLLICQCYKSGIVHLAKSGNGIGLCLAVHLVMALTRSNKILSIDLIDELKMNDEGVLREESNLVVSALLVAYSKALQPNSPHVALEYLVHIPDTATSRIHLKNGMALSQKAEKQIIRLLLETQAFNFFAGQITEDGLRPESGALDVYFSPGGVSNILSAAANDSILEGKVTDACELLSLAGQYTALLSVLNRKLASLVVVLKEEGIRSERQEQRQLWRDAAHRFGSMYLSQNHSAVIQKLEAEQKLSLVKDFDLLLNLMVFFDRCYDDDWKVSLH